MKTIYVGVEDDLTFEVANVLIGRLFGENYTAHRLHTKKAGGFGQIRGNLEKYLCLAEREPVVLITDLDRLSCAPLLIADWFQFKRFSRFLCFRVAVREVESWLMADKINLAKFLGVAERWLPRSVEEELEPKQRLIKIASKGRKNIRDELVGRGSDGAKQGFGYNEQLSKFVTSGWDPERAIALSDSLRRTCVGLTRLRSNIEVN